MPLRGSVVKTMDIKSMIFGSVVEIGDTVHLKAFTDALAVQRNKELFFVNEGNFRNYNAFNKPIPIPSLPVPPPSITKYNECPDIKVGNVHIITISSSAIVQIGTTNHINTEARVLHIRQISPGIQKDSIKKR
ncbi:spore germination protein GerPE [Siminovitchia fortis]|uniref:Spore germination protein GerPE n=1 Tax=Siminovitchia fortis TaxID=254758 RepID=A0A443J2A0_9BACI|nr:spore germination protein GerPE [Siminovitchia fortis]RWR14559.1 spore germination protein GerPE [Siminovitchia fortis]WHY83598.1 spore germination protein GerPE [Siminovitchia fortis]